MQQKQEVMDLKVYFCKQGHVDAPFLHVEGSDFAYLDLSSFVAG